MRILVIDQCSKDKAYPKRFTPYDTETIDTNSREQLLERSGTPAIMARNLYSGRQQNYIKQAVDTLRSSGDSVDRYFISAGFGVVAEDEQLPPYNVSFADCSADEISHRSAKLNIQDEIQELVSDGYDVIFFALGSDYYQSLDLDSVLKAIPSDTWVVSFNHESVVNDYENVVSLPARTEQAKEHETIVVALKGKYLQNFAEYRSHGKQVETIRELEKYCTSEYTTQSGLDEYKE